MRTARALTLSPSILCGGGSAPGRGVYLVPEGVYLVLGDVPGPRGVSAPGGCTWSWGVYLVPGGVPGPGGCTWSQGGVCSLGVYLVLGGVCSRGGIPGLGVYLVPWGCLLGGECLLRGVPGQVLPPCGQTHACKHITLPQTSFAGGNNRFSLAPLGLVPSAKSCIHHWCLAKNLGLDHGFPI